MENIEPSGYEYTGDDSITRAIAEADQWIKYGLQQVETLQVQIAAYKQMAEYAESHNLPKPDVSIQDMENNLETVRANLKTDEELRASLVAVHEKTLDLAARDLILHELENRLSERKKRGSEAN